MDAILRSVGTAAGVEDHAGDERIPERVADYPQAGQIPPGYSCAGLNLEGDHGPVVAFDDQVDFRAVMSTPVTEPGDAVHPRSLRADLPDGEGLEQVAELLQRGRACPGESVWGEAQQSCREPESITWSFGRAAARARSVVPHAGSRWTRNSASSSFV
jgi:hypothetical protein